MKLSDVLGLWVREVLAEYNLTEADLFSTVTDAGSDVKRLCLKVLPSKWEWCFPHLLNCALVEVRQVKSVCLVSRRACDVAAHQIL